MKKKEFNNSAAERRVLTVAATTEFAERYGFYIVQSLLIFILIDKYHISQSSANSTVGTAFAMIFISALVGGYISGRYLGAYRSGFLGSLFNIAAFFLLVSSDSQLFLYLGLSFLSISSGLIKSNMSSFIGGFYDKIKASNSRRDFGFNIFYMGMSFGAFLSLFLASWLKDHYGYNVPFYSCLLVL